MSQGFFQVGEILPSWQAETKRGEYDPGENLKYGGERIDLTFIPTTGRQACIQVLTHIIYHNEKIKININKVLSFKKKYKVQGFLKRTLPMG